MPLFHCSAILFDLDGVLCDSTKAVDREWREWAMDLARSERASLATLIDQLLAEKARTRGLPAPPSRGRD